MKISELVEKLSYTQSIIGDVQVLVKQDGFGGYGILTIDDIEQSSISSHDLDNAEMMKELFPDWDGNLDTIENFDEEVQCIEINLGTLLYST